MGELFGQNTFAKKTLVSTSVSMHVGQLILSENILSEHICKYAFGTNYWSGHICKHICKYTYVPNHLVRRHCKHICKNAFGKKRFFQKKIYPATPLLCYKSSWREKSLCYIATLLHWYSPEKKVFRKKYHLLHCYFATVVLV